MILDDFIHFSFIKKRDFFILLALLETFSNLFTTNFSNSDLGDGKICPSFWSLIGFYTSLNIHPRAVFFKPMHVRISNMISSVAYDFGFTGEIDFNKGQNFTNESTIGKITPHIDTNINDMPLKNIYSIWWYSEHYCI